MLFVFIAPILILASALLVPIACWRLGTIRLKRPRLFLAVTLISGVLIAAAAIAWFSEVLVGIGIAGASTAEAKASQAPLELLLLNRLLIALGSTIVLEYLICRIAQIIFGINSQGNARGSNNRWSGP